MKNIVAYIGMYINKKSYSLLVYYSQYFIDKFLQFCYYINKEMGFVPC